MIRLKICKIVLSLCWLVGFNLVFHNNGYSQIGTWTTFTNTNFVQDIAFENNTLWIASTGGVILFDVQTNEYIQTITNVDGLDHVVVTSMIIDQLGDVWFATDGGGLSKLNRPEFLWRTYGEFDGVALHVNILQQDGRNLWLGTDEGISFFQWGWDWDEQDTTFVWKENYDSRNGLPSDLVLSLAIDDSTIWVGTDAGVCMGVKNQNLKDPQNWTSFFAVNGLPSVEILSLMIEPSSIWAGTANGVAVFNGDSWIEAGLAGLRVYSLKRIEDRVWAATSGGVFCYQDEQWGSVHHQSLPERDVRVVSHQENGAIVCGTWGGGFALYDGNVWTGYETEGPWRNSFGTILVDQSGYVWCSTFEGLWTSKLSRYFDNQWMHFDESDGMVTGSGIVSMLVDSQGNKWFGTWGDGVSRLDDGGTPEKENDEWIVFDSRNSPLPGIPEDPTYEVVTSIQEDHAGILWFAAFGIGIVAYSPDENRWETYTPTDSLVDRLTRSIAIETDEQLWIGAEVNGTSRFNTAGTPFIKTDDHWNTFNNENNFTNTTVNAILYDNRETLWFATSEGLFYNTAGEFFRESHIQNTGVLCLGLDVMGNVWIGTSNQGVFVFDRNKNFKWHFDKASSGLIDNEVRSIALNTETGEIWLATPIGLSRYESGIFRPQIETDGVLMVPNPFDLSQNKELFINVSVVDYASVKIFSISGELVTDLEPQSFPIIWDGRNLSGQMVGSGIYIVVVSGPDMSPRMGKLAIIR